ncbi:MAG TPA: phage holin family protein [Candidatus Nanoarchaeia archaeon]
MRKKFRSTLLAILSFLLLAYFYPGFTFETTHSIALASLVFSLLYLFVRPLIKFLSLPANLITFGLFSLLINVALLYLVSTVVPGFDIVPFQFRNSQVLGFSIPSFYLNTFFSSLVASTALSLMTSIFFWIFS